MNAINIKNVVKKYQLKEELILAVNDVTYNFEYGKMYAIMGHSGSGKSTLIQCMGLLDDVTKGDIYINELNVSKLSNNEKNKIRNKEIGFIFQNYYLNNTMKSYENVMLPMLINEKLNNANLKLRAIKLLEIVGLENRIKHYPKELSGGEQQRVAIARAIANNPSIILADEPTGNLDEENEIHIFNILKKLVQDGKCVIVVSHNEIVKKYADVVINMKKGKFMENNNEI